MRDVRRTNAALRRVVLRDAVGINRGVGVRRVTGHGDIAGETVRGAFVDDEQGGGTVRAQRGVGGDEGIIARGAHDFIAGPDEVFVKPADVIRGVGVGGAVRDAVIAVLPPAVKIGTVIVARVLAVAEVPPYELIEFRLQQLTEAVREEQPFHKARRLLAGIGIDRIIFRAEQLDVRAGRAEVIVDLRAQIRRVIRPGGRRLQQRRVVLAAGPLRITVINHVIRRGSEAATKRERRGHGCK